VHQKHTPSARWVALTDTLDSPDVESEVPQTTSGDFTVESSAGGDTSGGSGSGDNVLVIPAITITARLLEWIRRPFPTHPLLVKFRTCL
jgi:hypothetical protein